MWGLISIDKDIIKRCSSNFKSSWVYWENHLGCDQIDLTYLQTRPSKLPRYMGNSWWILFWVESVTLLSVVFCVFFTVIHSRFCHCAWDTANMTFFLLLFHTLLSLSSFHLFGILLLLYIAHTDLHTNPLQPISIGRNTLHILVPHILIWAHRTLFGSFRWLPPLDLLTVLTVLQSQLVCFTGPSQDR